MSEYKNFIVDFPSRIIELDRKFRPLAASVELEVSYLLMKLTAVFLLPYERIEGTSGARRSNISDSQSIRKFLELDKLFREASYCSEIAQWSLLDVDDFHRGPRDWEGHVQSLDSEVVHKVLKTVRHAVAHSNLFFGGESTIEHIYLGSQKEKNGDPNKYRVVRGTVAALDGLVDKWIVNVQKLRTSPSLIWRELDEVTQ